MKKTIVIGATSRIGRKLVKIKSALAMGLSTLILILPRRKRRSMVSEVTMRLFLAMVQVLLIVISGRLVFGITIISSWYLVAAWVLLGACTFVSLGYMLVSDRALMEMAIAAGNDMDNWPAEAGEFSQGGISLKTFKATVIYLQRHV